MFWEPNTVVSGKPVKPWTAHPTDGLNSYAWDSIWGFHTGEFPKVGGLQGKTRSKWMTWGYPYFRKPSYKYVNICV